MDVDMEEVLVDTMVQEEDVEGAEESQIVHIHQVHQTPNLQEALIHPKVLTQPKSLEEEEKKED